jgi:hypothetical protein
MLNSTGVLEPVLQQRGFANYTERTYASDFADCCMVLFLAGAVSVLLPLCCRLPWPCCCPPPPAAAVCG